MCEGKIIEDVAVHLGSNAIKARKHQAPDLQPSILQPCYSPINAKILPAGVGVWVDQVHTPFINFKPFT